MSLELFGCDFDGPFLTTESIKNLPGIYLIAKWIPGSGYDYFIDVGESETVRDRLDKHDRKDCWARYASMPRYFVFYSGDWSEDDRRLIESAIRKKYDPPCGKV